MAKLPRVHGKEMVHFLVGHGFSVIRVRGSHYFLESTSHRTCVLVHVIILKSGTLRSILRDID